MMSTHSSTDNTHHWSTIKTYPKVIQSLKELVLHLHHYLLPHSQNILLHSHPLEFYNKNEEITTYWLIGKLSESLSLIINPIYKLSKLPHKNNNSLQSKVFWFFFPFSYFVNSSFLGYFGYLVSIQSGFPVLCVLWL